MNKNIFITTCVMLFVATSLIQGCSEEEFDIQDQPQLDIPEECAKIGVMHNAGLEYAFNDIKMSYVAKTRSGKITKLTKEDYATISKKSMLDFCEKNQYFGTSAKFCEGSINKLGKNVSTRSEDAVVLSPEVQQLMKEIRVVLAKNSFKKDLKIFRNDLDVINRKAKQLLSDTELIAIYAATSTCYNSYIYWRENYMKWNIALNYPELLSLYSDKDLNKLKIKNGKLCKLPTRNWWDNAWNSVGETWDSINDTVADWWANGGEDVVASDAGGAAAGAIAGALGGATVGGVGAGPGAIAGGISGGSYSSIDEAIQQWIKE